MRESNIYLLFILNHGIVEQQFRTSQRSVNTLKLEKYPNVVKSHLSKFYMKCIARFKLIFDFFISR